MGKTTVVREVMNHFTDRVPHYVERRRNPLFYTMGKDKICVLGSYENDCGGCDSIGSAPEVFKVFECRDKTQHIICEGALLSEDVIWSVKMGADVRIVFLTTPLDECFRRIESRQAKAGTTKPLGRDAQDNAAGGGYRARPVASDYRRSNLRTIAYRGSVRYNP